MQGYSFFISIFSLFVIFKRRGKDDVDGNYPTSHKFHQVVIIAHCLLLFFSIIIIIIIYVCAKNTSITCLLR